MGKASSSKKVSRVARTGGGRTTRRSAGSWGYPLMIAAVVVLGVLTVWLSRDASHHKAVAEAPTINDHWHTAYGFDVCGNFLPDLPQPPNLIGLHTHGDGVIHIEPQDALLDTGKHANLGRFVSGYPGLKLSRNSFTVLNQTWTTGQQKCGDQPGEVVVKSNGKTVTGDPNRLKIPRNGWITIAFVPKGTDVPPPPNWQDKVNRANGGAGQHSNTPTTMPNNAPALTPPASTPPASTPPTSAPAAPPTSGR